jgi:hypothetical protein
MSKSTTVSIPLPTSITPLITAAASSPRGASSLGASARRRTAPLLDSSRVVAELELQRMSAPSRACCRVLLMVGFGLYRCWLGAVGC